MEELLRGQEESVLIHELLAECSDYKKGCFLFPVRHHSPSCAFHLESVIKEYDPDAILIEGPENSSHLIPYMTLEGTQTPFCIYLSFDDKTGKVGEEPDQYRAYYPFLDYSPELAGIRAANKKNIFCEFIDLSYGEILVHTKADEEVYEDEKGFTLGEYYDRMTKHTGCKSFQELWEMLFEIEGYHMETEQFIRNFFFYCYYSRVCMEQNGSLEEKDRRREQAMIAHIKEAKAKYKRVLVVTGGMHTIALARYLLEPEEEGAGGEEKKILHQVKKEDSPAYLMPYSYEESDQAFGYQSGMIYPFYYEQVWKKIKKGKKCPYEQTALTFIMQTASQIRKKQPLSIADEMQSYYMARGLAALRGKKECGVFELLDAVKASFVKGEINAFYQPALRTLSHLLTGMSMGSVDVHAGVPPLVTDFLLQCKRFRIDTKTTLRKETRLDTYHKREHLEKSRFFWRMQFLDTGFCTCIKTQEDNKITGRIAIRESWEYRFHVQVQAELIKLSVYGGTLEQVCEKVIAKKMQKEHQTAASAAQIMDFSQKMGLSMLYEELFDLLTKTIGGDMDFISVMNCLECLIESESRNELLTGSDKTWIPKFYDLIHFNLNRSFTLFYTILHMKREEEMVVCKKIKYLYQYFINSHSELEEIFMTKIFSIYEEENPNGALKGVCAGILLKKEKIATEDARRILEAYFYGTRGNQFMAVSFLKGFFLTAKDVIFVDDQWIKMLNEILLHTDGEAFLALLPELRLAFTSFLPFEIDQIAKQVAALNKVNVHELLYHSAMDPKEMEMAVKLDAFCLKKLMEWMPEKGREKEAGDGSRNSQ